MTAPHSAPLVGNGIYAPVFLALHALQSCSKLFSENHGHLLAAAGGTGAKLPYIVQS